MEDLNFTQSPAKPDYDPVYAYKFFRSTGNEITLPAGKTVFVEDKKASRLLFQEDKMYQMIEGEVAITINKKLIATIHKGEIFGEMAFSTRAARSATATTTTQCKLIALDESQFMAALRVRPDFAIVLMSIMAERLREMIARLSATGALPENVEAKESAVFKDELLAELIEEIGEREIMRFTSGKTILQEGQAGVLMYVVLEGQVAVTIQNYTVERVSPGGMFGEIALIERTARLASAVAETDCALLPINRNVFLELVKKNPLFCVTLLSAVGDRALYIASQYAG